MTEKDQPTAQDEVQPEAGSQAPEVEQTVDAGAAAEQAASDEAIVDDELEAMRVEVARNRDAMLRMQAEMDNLRKRLIRDLEKSRKFALEKIMKDLLQVRDSLERGIEAIDETATVDSVREGKELTLKMLNKVTADHGLEVVDPVGQPFDPEFHEAMTMIPSPDHAENTVIEVLQKGFKLHDRLIRPAMVVVAGAN